MYIFFMFLKQSYTTIGFLIKRILKNNQVRIDLYLCNVLQIKPNKTHMSVSAHKSLITKII